MTLRIPNVEDDRRAEGVPPDLAECGCRTAALTRGRAGPNVEPLAGQQQSRRGRRSNRFQLREPFPGDPMKVVRQAGAIVVRFDDDEPRLLLVTARRNPKTWIFPKGHIEDGETPAEAAVREAREEAGVVGRALGSVGSLEVDFEDVSVDVEYFLLTLEKDKGESNEGRKRRWCTREEALDRLEVDETRALVEKALARLAANPTRGARKARG
jgi:8-oxo-dGTP pyrophosphatase MutT (NUDIX family)